MTFVKMPALRDNVKVFYRIFPTEQQSTPHIRLDRDSRKIFVRNLQELSKKFLEEKISYWEFDSDGLFANVEQDVIYSEVVSGVVENVANGYTSVIIAYGQSSSGKTFTVGGLHFTEEDFGILPRAVKHLFYIKSLQPKNAKMSIYISCLEFDGKFAVDLLKEVPNIVNLYKTKDATKIKISTEYEALKYIFIAEGRKTFAENCEGYLSNIYTSVVTFHVTLKNSDLTDPRELISRLHIIDLAGNDYAANRGRFSKRSNQIGGANVTKSNLEQFVICLRENTQHSVKLKYRSHCLLYYLDGDLSNNNMLRFIGHIKTSKQDLKLTISTLRFGNLVMGLKPQRKYVNNGELKMHYLNEAYLNPELLNEDLTGALNEENIFHIDRTIEEFLKNNINEITLMNVADAAVALKKLRELCQQYENEIKQLREATLSRSEASLKQEMLRQEQGSQIESGTKVSSKKMSRKSKGSATNDLRSSGNASTDVSFSQTLINTTQQTPSQDKNRPSLESVGKYDSTSSYRNSYPSSPEKVCDVEDMWKIFSSQSSCYRETLEEYKRNETYIHDSYRIFLDEVKKMQKLKSHVDKCIIELITAQTFSKRCNLDEFDENGFPFKSFAEQTCQLHEAQQSLIVQQERVLKYREDFKTCADIRHGITKRLKEEFSLFCREQYDIPNPSMDIVENALESYINFDMDLDGHGGQETGIIIPPISAKAERIKHLQYLLQKEMQKKAWAVSRKKRMWKSHIILPITSDKK